MDELSWLSDNTSWVISTMPEAHDFGSDPENWQFLKYSSWRVLHEDHASGSGIFRGLSANESTLKDFQVDHLEGRGPLMSLLRKYRPCKLEEFARSAGSGPLNEFCWSVMTLSLGFRAKSPGIVPESWLMPRNRYCRLEKLPQRGIGPERAE